MSKNKLESMRNFKYFIKLKKTKKKSTTEFFSSFFSFIIPKKKEPRKYKMNIFQYKELIQETSEDILIKELKKPIFDVETNLLQLSSDKLNNYLNNSNNHYDMDRNINTMLSIIKKNKKCQKYFILNSLSEKYIRLLLSFSEHEFYIKGSPIYKNNSKPNAFYLVIKGKVSLRTLNQEKIKNEINKRKNQFLSIFNKIEVEDKFNGIYCDEYYEKISVNNFISKTNIVINQQDDNNLNNLNNLKKKDIKKTIRRSFTRDYNMFKKNLNFNPKRIVEDKILIKNLMDLQRDLSIEIKSYSPGDFFGELDLILDKPHPENAYAEENTDLLVLNKKYFDKYFLKHLIKVDNERRLFLTKRIEFLHINNVINLKPEFYDKNTIIYTQFDYAKAFYIIYKGRGALKQISNKECKKKSDVIFYKDDMKTLCLVDRGCVVGFEACKDGRKKYDNNFIIIEDNTILYPVKMEGVSDDNYIKKKNRIQLKKELGILYLAQNDILPKSNYERKRLTKEDLKFKNKEEKIYNMFFDAKDFYWRTILNRKKMDMKIKYLGNLNDINKNIYHSNYNKLYSNTKSSGKINLKKLYSKDYNSNRKKSQKRNITFKYLTSINKKSKENSKYSFQEKEEISKKSNKHDSNTVISHKLETLNLINSNISEYSNNKIDGPYLKNISIDINNKRTFSQRPKKDKKFLTLKNFKFPNLFKEEKNETKEIINKYYSTDNRNFKNKFDKNYINKPKKQIQLTKNVVDKYITKLVRISNENNINYNSGNFKMPLIGTK